MSVQDTLKQLAKNLHSCMNTDRHGLKRQLDKLRSEVSKGKDVSGALQQLADKIERSVSRCKQRRASVPTINYPDLPVSGKKDEIAELIKNNQVTIVCGETGSGKTTQLPNNDETITVTIDARWTKEDGTLSLPRPKTATFTPRQTQTIVITFTE